MLQIDIFGANDWHFVDFILRRICGRAFVGVIILSTLSYVPYVLMYALRNAAMRVLKIFVASSLTLARSIYLQKLFELVSTS